jgi:hypothetical protein
MVTVTLDGGSATCLLPELAAGLHAVVVTVAGAGAAAMPGGGAAGSLPVALAVREVTPSRGSFFGGLQLAVNGTGLTPGNDSRTAMTVSVTGSTPPPVLLSSSSFRQALLTLPRFVATSSAATLQLNLQLRVSEVAGNKTIATAVVPLMLDRAWTPLVSDVAPRAAPANTPVNLSLTWAVSAAATPTAGIGNASAPPGSASLASVVLQAGNSSRTVACVNATVLRGVLNGSTGNVESLSCLVADGGLSASDYAVWVCLPSIGCGYRGPTAVSVNASVSAISPAAGSTAGGTLVTLQGTGFSAAPSDVQVQFGGSSCQVVSSSQTSVLCITGALPGNASAGTSLPLILTPALVSPEEPVCVCVHECLDPDFHAPDCKALCVCRGPLRRWSLALAFCLSPASRPGWPPLHLSAAQPREAQP